MQKKYKVFLALGGGGVGRMKNVIFFSFWLGYA